MLRNYLTIAFRNLRKRLGYTALNVIGLAVGLASCILIGLWIQDELSYDTFHEKADRIVRLTTTFGDKGPFATTPSLFAPAFMRTFPEVQNAVRVYDATRYGPYVVERGNQRFQEERFFYADSTFFDVFSFAFLAGSPETALARPNAAVLTETTARKYFGDEAALGKTITANNRTEFEVTGVIEDVPGASHMHFDFLASLATLQAWSQLSDDAWRSANFFTYLLLRDEAAATSLAPKIPSLVERVSDDPGRASANVGMQPLTDIHLYSHVESEIEPNGDIQYVYIFAVAAFLILVVACANYVNLTTARSAQRAREVAMRKALGAHRGQLARQFYAESTLMTFAALLLALVLAEAALPLLNTISGKELDLWYADAPLMLLVLGGLGLGVSLLAGSYPALVLSAFQPARVLKSGGADADGGGTVFRKGLVVLQFAISVFLMVGTAVVYNQLDYMQHQKLGFDKERVVVLSLGGDRQTYETMKRELVQEANVLSVAGIASLPGAMQGLYKGAAEGVAEEEYPFVTGVAADEDVVESLDLDVVAGRDFRSKSHTYRPEEDGYVYLLNEAAVRALGWTPQEAVGKWFNLLGGRKGEVIGVVNDFHFASMHEAIAPLALFMHPRQYEYLMVKVGPRDVPTTLAALERTWARVAPDRPFEYNFLDQHYDALYRLEARTGQVLGVFSVLAALIACLGLFGLAAYAAQRRTQEIGVRKALGATAANIVVLLSTDFLKLVGIGFVIAGPVAYIAVHRWLQDFAYHIEVGLSLFVGAGIAAIVIAMLAVSIHAIRAARTDPVEALRYE